MHLYKTTMWEDAAGDYLVNDVTSMTSIAIKWWIPMRMLNLTPTEYLKMLKDKFYINSAHYSETADVLTFTFANEADARRYKNWINKQARDRNCIFPD